MGYMRISWPEEKETPCFSSDRRISSGSPTQIVKTKSDPFFAPAPAKIAGAGLRIYVIFPSGKSPTTNGAHANLNIKHPAVE